MIPVTLPVQLTHRSRSTLAESLPHQLPSSICAGKLSLDGGVTGIVNKLLSSRVFPGVKSDWPLPADPDGLASLEHYLVRSPSTPPPAEPNDVPHLAEIAHRISGKAHQLDPDRCGFLSITLTFNEQDEDLLKLTSSGVMILEHTEYEWLLGRDTVERFLPAAFHMPGAGKGVRESDSHSSAQADMTGSSTRCR